MVYSVTAQCHRNNKSDPANSLGAYSVDMVFYCLLLMLVVLQHRILQLPQACVPVNTNQISFFDSMNCQLHQVGNYSKSTQPIWNIFFTVPRNKNYSKIDLHWSGVWNGGMCTVSTSFYRSSWSGNHQCVIEVCGRGSKRWTFHFFKTQPNRAHPLRNRGIFRDILN